MFIPAIVALIRKKGRFGTVVFVSSLSVAFGFAAALNPFNALFGMAAWTLHGACWIIALLFALQNKTDEIKQEVHIHNVYQPTSPQQPRPVAVPRPVAQVQPVAVPRVVAKPLPPSVNPHRRQRKVTILASPLFPVVLPFHEENYQTAYDEGE